MERMGAFFRKLRLFVHRDRLERDLAEEMGHHLAMKAANTGDAAGDSAAARRQFGNVTRLKEESRAMWTWTFWEQCAQDLRYALRMMAANPLFTAMAALSLALGIGANTAIYSFMDAIMMRALPVQHPEQLAVFEWRSKGRPPVIHHHTGTRHGDKNHGVSSPDFPLAAFDLFRTDSDVFTSVFAYAGAARPSTVVQGQAEIVDAELVSGNYFDGLGVYPAAGRMIREDDGRFGSTPVAVISYPWWQRRFAGSAAAVGQSILVNGTPFIIAGVSPPDFFGVDPAAAPELMIPLHAGQLLAPRPERYRERFVDKNFYWVDIMGRLRPGVTIGQAQARMAAQFHEFALSTASTAEEKAELPALFLDEGGSGLDSLRREYSKPVYVLMAMVGLILAIACANIANLLLARATARRREMAVRLSLGASRFRVVRQLLTESVLLSVLGGALGILVAAWGIRSITWLLANGRDRFTLHATIDWPVLGFTFALAVVCGLLFGLAPALQGTRVDLTPALKESRASAPRGRLHHAGMRIGLSHALVVSQIAISLLLVVGAGLFVHTLSNLRSVALGFNRENVLLFSLNARPAGYKGAAIARFYGNLWDRFRTIPGVRNASSSSYPLVSGYWDDERLMIPGQAKTGSKELSTCKLEVGPSFLATMQIPILLGREIEQRDLDSPRVAVVNEKFVKKYFAGQNPVGRRIGIGEKDSPADIEIVGVAKTSLYNSLKEEDTPPVAYVPYTHDVEHLGEMVFELRSAGDPLALVNTVRQIVHQASPVVPVSDVSTQAQNIDQTISQERTFAGLCGCFAVLALLIASIGLYGSVAYAVARRTGEIGIRMALGAQSRRIVWMILGEVITLATVGLGIGMAAAYGLTHFVASFLFGIKPHDPLALSVSVMVLAASMLFAGYAPARRASRVDPMAALRHE
jgi:macrolide transport system ATP-binding/permease protein